MLILVASYFKIAIQLERHDLFFSIKHRNRYGVFNKRSICKMKYLLFIFASFYLVNINCGTTNHYIPLRSLEKGENYTGIHLTYAMNNFTKYSFQLSYYRGLGNKNVIGTTISNSIIPSFFSFVHYEEKKKNNLNYQIHLNFINAINFCPASELRFGYSTLNGDLTKSFHLGIGKMDSPLYWSSWDLVPTLGYSIQSNGFRFNIESRFGMTKYIVKMLKQRPDTSKVDIVLNTDDIITIKYGYGSYGRGYGPTIILKDSSALHIKDAFPTPDCIPCEVPRYLRDKFTASKNHRNYWIYLRPMKGEYKFFKNDWPHVYELDLEAIIKRYEKTGILIIKEDEDLVEKNVSNIKFWPHDFHFDFGYQKRN